MIMVCSKKAKLMILSLLMILILLITWTAAPLLYSRAVLTEVVVVGGGALTLGMLLDLLMTCFGASGMDGAVRNQAAAVGTPPVAFVGNLLNRFLAATLSAVAPGEWAQTIANGMTVLSNGTIFLDSDATAAVADFQQWAWEEEGGNLEQFANIVTGDGNLTGGGYTAYVQDCSLGPLTYQNNEYYYASDWLYGTLNSVAGDTAVALSGQTGRCYVIAQSVSGQINAIRYMVYVPNTAVSRVGWATASSNGTVGMVFTKATTGAWQQLTDIDKRYNESYLPVQAAGTLPDISDMIGEDTVAGDVETFVGPMMQGQGTELPLGDVVTVSSEAAGRLHLENYLRAMAAAYAGDGTADVPVTDDNTGDDDTFPVSVPLDTPIGVIGLSDSAIDQSGATTGSDSIAQDFAETQEFTMDLTQFFPFCIPFDLQYLFEKLRADPEAIKIEWHFKIPYLDVDIPIEIDLAPFDPVARILRSLEVIAFCVGLMFYTKNLIQGGD